MRRRLAALAAVAALLAVAVTSEMRMRAMPREDPLGRRLLYLPTYEALDLISLGNEGLTADLLYLWCIQYYAALNRNEQFLYLETMFDLITDLDPLYYDAYTIGGMIMGMAVGRRPELEQALIDFYDKGLAAMPDDWALAEVAAWDFYTVLKDPGEAVRYAEIGASRPDAPSRLMRLAGRWRDSNRLWTPQESVEYWRQAVAEATTDFDRRTCLGHLYDVYVEIDRERLEPMLKTREALDGHCPDSWQPFIDDGILDAPPLDFAGTPYTIEPMSCTLLAMKEIRRR